MEYRPGSQGNETPCNRRFRREVQRWVVGILLGRLAYGNKDIGRSEKSAGRKTKTDHKNSSLDIVSLDSSPKIQEEDIPTDTSEDSDQYNIIESLHEISEKGKDSSNKRSNETTSENDVSIEIQSIEDEDSNSADGTNKEIKNSRMESVSIDDSRNRKVNKKR